MIDAILERAGINPPGPDKNRTQCPQCSHRRRKAQERCLMVKWIGWVAQVYCHHCGWKETLQ